jgi:hypothetical protein
MIKYLSFSPLAITNLIKILAFIKNRPIYFRTKNSVEAIMNNFENS